MALVYSRHNSPHAEFQSPVAQLHQLHGQDSVPTRKQAGRTLPDCLDPLDGAAQRAAKAACSSPERAWLLSAQYGASSPCSPHSSPAQVLEERPRSAFVKWDAKLHGLQRGMKTSLPASDKSMPAKRSWGSDKPSSSGRSTQDMPGQAAFQLPSRHSNSHSSAQPFAPSEAAAKRFRPTSPQQPLDLAALCEQANAAVREAAVPPMLSGSARMSAQLPEQPLASPPPPRMRNLAQRQALEAAQRRHLNARLVQAAWHASSVPPPSPPSTQALQHGVHRSWPLAGRE